MVERYLLRKSLMKPLQEYFESKNLKKSDQKRLQEQMMLMGSSKDLGKNVITDGLETANGSLTKKQLTKTSELTSGGSLFDDGTKTIIKEVCCCTTMQKNRFG